MFRARRAGRVGVALERRSEATRCWGEGSRQLFRWVHHGDTCRVAAIRGHTFGRRVADRPRAFSALARGHQSAVNKACTRNLRPHHGFFWALTLLAQEESMPRGD